MHTNSDNNKRVFNISSKKYLSKVTRKHIFQLIGSSFVLLLPFIVYCNVDDLNYVRSIFINMQMQLVNIFVDSSFEQKTCSELKLQYKEKMLDQLFADAKSVETLMSQMSAYKNVHIGRVITTTVNDYTSSIVINIGKINGVAKDDYIVNELGLIGRISDVSENWSSAILTTDVNSSIPIKFKSSENMAIAQGNSHNRIKITMKNGTFNVNAGDIVVTSGYGGLFLPDIPVGIVDDNDLIQPCFDFKTLRFVCVIGHMPY